MDDIRISKIDRIGLWAAIAAAAETILFAGSLVGTLAFGLRPTLSYVSSMLLAPTVVTLMAAVYSRTVEPRRIFGLLALVSALLYAPFCMGNYFVQLAVVSQNPLNVAPDVLRLVAFVPGSPAFALDMLGYVFLCLSTLCAAFTVVGTKHRPLRVLCIVHGVLALPTIAAPLMSAMYRTTNSRPNSAGIWVNLFWCAVFAPLALLFGLYFRGPNKAET